jgi:hypothetical protein
MTFAWTIEQKEKNWLDDQAEELTEAFNTPDPHVADVGEKPTEPELTTEPEIPAEIVTGTPEIEDRPGETIEETELDKWNKMIEEAEREVAKAQETTVEERIAKGESYIDNEGNEITLEADLPEEESKKNTYMIKDEQGTMITKTKE